MENKESILATVTYDNTAVIVKEGVSILEALEKENFTIPFSCRAGVCHSCMMQGEDNIPEDAQQGLSANQIAQGCFLACSCYPYSDMNVRLRGTADLSQGKVVDKKMLNASVMALFIQVDFRWFPGQYLTLWKNELEGRSYSIASRCDTHRVIELHIKRHELGMISRWIHDDVTVDDNILLSTPLGSCFYTDDHHDKPILMAGTGTGLAPLYGILQEALAQQHSRPIYLYAASGEPDGLYYIDELTRLDKEYDIFTYTPTVRRNAQEGMIEQDLVDVLQSEHPDLHDYKVFLCGAPSVVKTIQRNCFFQGASINDILVDAFEMTVPNE